MEMRLLDFSFKYFKNLADDQVQQDLEHGPEHGTDERSSSDEPSSDSEHSSSLESHTDTGRQERVSDQDDEIEWSEVENFENSCAAFFYLTELKKKMKPTKFKEFEDIEDYWRALSVEDFMKVFSGLRTHKKKQRDFLNCLVETVVDEHHGESDPEKRKGLLKLERMMNIPKGAPLYVAKTKKGFRDTFVGCSVKELQDLFEQYQNGYYRPQVLRTHHLIHTLAFTSAVKLFDTEDVQSQARIIKALADTDPGSEVFGTVLGRALLTNGWDSERTAFRLQVAFDMFFLVVLWFLAWDLRAQKEPSKVLFLAILAVSSITVATHVIELLGCIFLYGWAWFSKWASKWNLFNFFLQLVVCYVLFHMLYSWVFVDSSPWAAACTKTSHCWLRLHPVQTMCLAGVKVVQVIIALLCTEHLGKYVLPAYHAVASRASVHFILFVLICIIGSFIIYYMLPIHANMVRGRDPSNFYEMYELQPIHWKPLISSFMRMFRIDVVGDTSMSRLQGLHEIFTLKQNLSGNLSAGAEIARLDTNKPDATYYLGVELFFMFLVLVVNLMVLNVYIGLLTTIYAEEYKRRHRVLSRFRGQFVWRLLLRRYMWQRILNCCGRRRPGAKPRYVPYPFDSYCRSKSEQFGGIWIAYDEDCSLKSPPQKYSPNGTVHTGKTDSESSDDQRLQQETPSKGRRRKRRYAYSLTHNAHTRKI